MYELGGAWVRFGDGATILKVSFATDFSAVCIRNLPPTSSRKSVQELLADVGIKISADEVRVTTRMDQQKCSAVIKSENPSFAKLVCSKLQTYTTLPDIKAAAIPVTMPQSRSLHQVESRKVHCSWHRPTREAVLKFGTRAIATRVSKNFNAGRFQVLGNRVTAGVPNRQDNQGNPAVWTVTLTGLAETTEEKHITQNLPESDRPRTIEIGKPSYITDLEFDSTIVKSMLLDFGPLDRWEVSSSSKGKRINVFATFLEESAARDAVSSLNNKPLSFSDTTRLSIRLVTLAKFKVPIKVYDAVRQRVTTQREIWERQHIHFFEHHTRGQFNILKLEGENYQRVAQAKELLEKMFSGEVIRMDGKDLHSANFRKGGDDFKIMKELEGLHCVVIVPNIHRSQFQVFGLTEKSASALENIRTTLQASMPESHVINLNADEFKWVSKGGLKVLEAQLGRGIATLSITPRHKRIYIRGSKADKNRAMTIIDSRRAGSAVVIETARGAETEKTCPSCLCEAEDPIHTSCGHVYCSECFDNMCVAAMTGTGEFRISCIETIGDGDGIVSTCQRAFSLTELREQLPYERFEEVLRASFASHVGRHPADFKYCPTPDCDQIYRVATSGATKSSSSSSSSNPLAATGVPPSTFTCGKCLAPTCTACHRPHLGKTTCASKAPGSSSRGGELVMDSKRKEELGIKDCPRCGTLLEKTGGCNHMECRCGAHVCWRCLAAFGKSGECYEHMRKVHGGHSE